MARLRLNVHEADGDLPMVCMRCGAAATVTRTRRMSWYPRWVWILLLVNLIVVIIVAAILTKRATLKAPLCEQHKRHWSRRLLIGWLSFLALVAFVVGDIVVMTNAPRHVQDSQGAFAVLAGLGAFLIWLITLIILSSTAIRPAEITDTDLVVDGVAPAFIDALDEAEVQRRLKLRDLRTRRYEEDEYAPRPVRPADAIHEDTPRRHGSDAIEE